MKTQTPPPRPLTHEAAERQNILVYSPAAPMEHRLATFLRKHGFQSLYICTEPQRFGDMLDKHRIDLIVAPDPEVARPLRHQFAERKLRVVDLPHRNGTLDETRWRKALIAALYRRSEGGVQ